MVFADALLAVLNAAWENAALDAIQVFCVASIPKILVILALAVFRPPCNSPICVFWYTSIPWVTMVFELAELATANDAWLYTELDAIQVFCVVLIPKILVILALAVFRPPCMMFILLFWVVSIPWVTMVFELAELATANAAFAWLNAADAVPPDEELAVLNAAFAWMKAAFAWLNAAELDEELAALYADCAKLVALVILVFWVLSTPWIVMVLELALLATLYADCAKLVALVILVFWVLSTPWIVMVLELALLATLYADCVNTALDAIQVFCVSSIPKMFDIFALAVFNPPCTIVILLFWVLSTPWVTTVLLDADIAVLEALFACVNADWVNAEFELIQVFWVLLTPVKTMVLFVAVFAWIKAAFARLNAAELDEELATLKAAFAVLYAKFAWL